MIKKLLNRFKKKPPTPDLSFAIQDGPSEFPRTWTLECDENGNFLVWGQKLNPGQRVRVEEILKPRTVDLMYP